MGAAADPPISFYSESVAGSGVVSVFMSVPDPDGTVESALLPAPMDLSGLEPLPIEVSSMFCCSVVVVPDLIEESSMRCCSVVVEVPVPVPAADP